MGVAKVNNYLAKVNDYIILLNKTGKIISIPMYRINSIESLKNHFHKGAFVDKIPHIEVSQPHS